MMITSKEETLLQAIKNGMDEPNKGWLHEMSPWDSRTNSGVMSSLIQKGYIESMDDDGDYWVSLTPSGLSLFD